MNNKTVVSEISAAELCVGCGVCTAICPTKRLSLRLAERGIYAVREDTADCAKNCERCLTVCPFSDRVPDESEIGRELYGSLPGIGHHDLTGYYRSVHAGYARRGDYRARGASGGMATWALASLLEQKVVDRIVCVGKKDRSHPFFDFRVCDTVDEVRASSKSTYYPVEMSGVLAEIMGTPGTCAVIGLPCFCKALRLLTQQSRKARGKIQFIAGLMCSHGASAYFSEYVTEKAGGHAGRLREVNFRVKSPERPANDFGTECVWEEQGDVRSRTLYWRGDMSKAWRSHWFSPLPCLFCDDIFAETADITFADAWLPAFTRDPQGTNFVIVRSELASELCRRGVESGEIALEPLTAGDVAGRQKGVTAGKRQGVSYRLWLKRRRGEAVPRKRGNPEKTGDLLQRMRWKGEIKAAESGPRQWVNRRSVHDFEVRMRRIEVAQRFLKRAIRLVQRF
jgi:coenzyme F420-reducing hydrogenase beta subunit